MSRRLTASLALSILVSAVGYWPAAVYAQSATRSPYGNRGELSLENPYRPPEVFVPQLTITNQQNNTITGEFEVWNKSQALLGDLTYRIDLLSPLTQAPVGEVVADKALVYDRFVSTDAPFVLGPDERRTLQFAYTPPVVPPGDYRLQLLMTTSQGRDMGWKDVALTLMSAPPAFADIFATSLRLPEFPEEILEATSGPNVGAGASVTARAAVLTRERAMTVLPVLTVYEFDVARGEIARVEGKTTHLSPATPQQIDVPVTVAVTPGIYYALLELRDVRTQERLSSLGEYRWVVRGPDADILTTRILTIATAAGETMHLQVDYAGAADAETTQQGALTVALKDAAGELATLTVPNIELTDAIGGGEARLRLPRDLTTPFFVTTVITTEAGEPLDEYQVSYAGNVDTLRTWKDTQRRLSVYQKIGVAAIVLGLAVGLFAFMRHWQRRRRRVR